MPNGGTGSIFDGVGAKLDDIEVPAWGRPASSVCFETAKGRR
jgi:hypothetical protein